MARLDPINEHRWQGIVGESCISSGVSVLHTVYTRTSCSGDRRAEKYLASTYFVCHLVAKGERPGRSGMSVRPPLSFTLVVRQV